VSFRLRKVESIGRNFRRLVGNQIENAQACLEPKQRIADQQVHNARKSLKRARAALRLFRSAIAKGAFTPLNATFRDAASTGRNRSGTLGIALSIARVPHSSNSWPILKCRRYRRTSRSSRPVPMPRRLSNAIPTDGACSSRAASRYSAGRPKRLPVSQAVARGLKSNSDACK